MDYGLSEYNERENSCIFRDAAIILSFVTQIYPQEFVQLTFEQIIPGTQRLVAKCPSDHPFYIRHKGWSSANPTESMARYGIPFRALHVNEVVSQAPQNKLAHTPGNTISPLIATSGPQM